MAATMAISYVLYTTLFHSVTADFSSNTSANFTSTFMTSPKGTATQYHFTTAVDTGNVVTMFGLSTSQLMLIGFSLCGLIAILIIICGVMCYLKHKKRKERSKQIPSGDEKDATQAKIDAFDIHITENALAAHSVQTAYIPNPLTKTRPERVTSASSVGSHEEALTVGDLMTANAHVQPKDVASNVTSETPVVKDETNGNTTLNVQHLTVNLYEDTEEEPLRELPLTPHTPSNSDDQVHLGAGHKPMDSANTMRYDANAPSQLTLILDDQPSNDTMQEQDTLRTINTLMDQDTIRSDVTNETMRTMKYVGDQNTPSDDSTYDTGVAAVPPVQVPDTLTAIIQQHKSNEPPVDAPIVTDTLTAIIQQSKQ
eukprot:206836_1